jgi:hypothetical protein
MEACLERKEPTPVETNVAGHLEEFNGAMREETVWATDNQFRDWRLPVRHHRPIAEEKDPWVPEEVGRHRERKAVIKD